MTGQAVNKLDSETLEKKNSKTLELTFLNDTSWTTAKNELFQTFLKTKFKVSDISLIIINTR